MSGVDSSVILVNLTNDTKIANKAIVTGISSSGTQSPSQGNVHHMIMPASNGNRYTIININVIVPTTCTGNR